MSIEKTIAEMGLDLPVFGGDGYYGATYGTMKPFHRTGNLLFLSRWHRNYRIEHSLPARDIRYDRPVYHRRRLQVPGNYGYPYSRNCRRRDHRPNRY